MRTSLNIPQEILEEFDETWEAEGMESRSRAVREAMQEYTERHTRLEAIEGEAVATVAFDYEHTLVIGDLHTVQHDFEDVINTMQHMHHGEWCLETIFCTGSADRVRELVYHLRDFDAVGRVNVMFLQPVEQ
ncbi:CopG family transcriptional regulator [Halobacteriales archaeon QS_3_64_16]|nr:MAG: CopG family transcriptional regulator [Halobacteriales archaeon QS_3_64_16]